MLDNLYRSYLIYRKQKNNSHSIDSWYYLERAYNCEYDRNLFLKNVYRGNHGTRNSRAL